MDGEAWQAMIHGVAKSQTQLSDSTFFHLYIIKYQSSCEGDILLIEEWEVGFYILQCQSLTHVRLFAHHAPLSVGFSRQEYWSGLPFPSPGDLSNPGIEARSSVLQADSLPPEPGKLSFNYIHIASASIMSAQGISASWTS